MFSHRLQQVQSSEQSSPTQPKQTASTDKNETGTACDADIVKWFQIQPDAKRNFQDDVIFGNLVKYGLTKLHWTLGETQLLLHYVREAKKKKGAFQTKMFLLGWIRVIIGFKVSFTWKANILEKYKNL